MTCEVQNFVTVITGEERNISISFKKEDGSPYTLNDPDEIIVKFRNSDNSLLEKSLTVPGEVTIVSDVLGEILVNLQEADTEDLRVAERQDFSVDLIKGTVTRKVIFSRGITVVQDLA